MPLEITVPRLGWSMEEGTFVRWLVDDGVWVKRGDLLFELEGEKAVQPIESFDEGILHVAAQAVQPGQTVRVGEVVGLLLARGEAPPSATASKKPATQAAKSELVKPEALQSAPPAAGPAVRRRARELGVELSALAGTGSGGRILTADVERAAKPDVTKPANPARKNSSRAVATPRARRLATELSLDWAALSGTGAGGRIRECDVRAAADSLRTNGQGTASVRIPITARRRTIAQRMLASCQQTAPVTLTTKADATNLVSLRNQFKATGATPLIPSYTDILMKLTALALEEHPLLAGRWREEFIELPGPGGIHMGIAVDTEAGLIVPVVQNVGQRSLLDVAADTKRLAAAAREGKLTAAELQGGVFTVTSLGAWGIDAFTPIINLPEVAILGIGAIRREPVALDDGQLAVRDQISLSLTFDHRVVDGAPAARFLQAVCTAVANPSAWLLRAASRSSKEPS